MMVEVRTAAWSLTQQGNLYGTASTGSKGGRTAFEMIPVSIGWTFNVLYEFCRQYHCPDGSHPSGLAMDASGQPVRYSDRRRIT